MSPHQFSREGMALPQGRGDFQKVSVVCYIGLLSFLKLLKIKKGLFPSFTIMPLFITFCRIVIKMVSWRKFLEHFLGQLHVLCHVQPLEPRRPQGQAGGSPEHLLLASPPPRNCSKRTNTESVSKLPAQRLAHTGTVLKSPL